MICLDPGPDVTAGFEAVQRDEVKQLERPQCAGAQPSQRRPAYTIDFIVIARWDFALERVCSVRLTEVAKTQ